VQHGEPVEEHPNEDDQHDDRDDDDRWSGSWIRLLFDDGHGGIVPRVRELPQASRGKERAFLTVL
jgi:hypothetical protein